MVGTDVGRDGGGGVVTERKRLRQRYCVLNPKPGALLADDGGGQLGRHRTHALHVGRHAPEETVQDAGGVGVPGPARVDRDARRRRDIYSFSFYADIRAFRAVGD